MHSAGLVAFRLLGGSAAIILYGLTVACEWEPSGPDRLAIVGPPRVERVARARVIEPGDRRIPNPPAVDAWSSAGIADPLNLAFDAKANRFLILESSTNELVEMLVGSDSRIGRPTGRFDARSFGVRDPRGLTIDPSTGSLFILDGGSRIVRVDADPRLGFHRALISSIDLAPVGLSNARGIAFDPTSGHLHVLDPVAQAVHQLSPRGQIVATWDVSEFRLTDLEGMTFGPTGDNTDDPSAMGLYVGTGKRVTELSLIKLAADPPPAVTGTLSGTTLTSGFSPPSPDPSGITYATHLGRLVIGDAEVEEMSIYAGANIFETTVSGTLSGTWTTVAFSDEPTGTAYNPVNRHLFISDDDDRQIYEVDPGADGLYGTTDDRLTSFDTGVFGCNDPEGVAFDGVNGVLFIADGVNAQVWRVSPGINGLFDGVSPAGDDQVTSFDTQVHGLIDPEGIAFDSDFAHLYVVGQPVTQVFHFTTTGTPIRVIDISAAQADKPAGLEYAPSSVNPGAQALYIVDRGVDNDEDSEENDGKMYEFSLPPFSGNALPTVTITAPPNGSTFTQGATITFTGTASDAEDGNLTSAIAWTSTLNGALGSGESVSTSTLSTGTHTITASVTDGGGASASATIAVTVNAAGAGPPVDVRIAASADDAEESAAGTMSRTSSDLELVNDRNDQTVGLRFNAVAIPPGATISRAYVQFQADERHSAAASLTVRGQATDNAAAFASAARNISSRTMTVSAVPWSPLAWTVVGQAGPDQQTPSLTAVVQEIVDRPGWRSGNSLAIIISGTGRRTAEAFDGTASGAPLLHVEYSTRPNTAPAASDVSIAGTAQVGQTLTGNYVYGDAEDDAEAASTYRWLRNGEAIPGATAQTYALVTADEGTLIRFEVTPRAATGDSPGNAAQSAEIGPVAAAPVVSAEQSTLTAAPTSIPAVSGVSTITVTVKDQTGAPMSGVTVVLSASGSGNSLTQPSGPTSALGVATGTLSSSVPENKTVSATANGTAITQTATVEVREAPPTEDITHELLTSGNNTVNQKIYTTASISPVPNTLITVAVLGHNSSSAAPSPTISGGGMSAWTQVATITYDALALPLKRVTIFRAMSGSPGSGPITITFKSNQSHAQWIVSQWGGVDVSGVNGAGAIVQSGSSAADAVNGLTLTLTPFANANNVAYGVFSVASRVPAITPGAGFTEIAEQASAESPLSALQAQWTTNDETIDATWTNLRGAVLGVEIRARQP